MKHLKSFVIGSLFCFILMVSAEAQKPTNSTEVPQPPVELALDANKLVMNVGDKWLYRISSADEALDGKTLEISLKEKDSAKFLFSVQFGDAESKTASIPNSEAEWFMPMVTEKGNFLIQAVDQGEYPPSVKRGVRWNSRMTYFKYDDFGNPLGSVSQVRTASDPLICAVPAGTFDCVEITKQSDIVESQMWLSPNNSFAVQSRVRRSEKGPLIGFILISFESTAQSENVVVTKNSFVPVLSASERQEAIEWIRANNKFGEGSDVVGDVLFLLDMGVGLYPKAAVRITVGSAVTKSGKGYILECRSGKFAARGL
jgi:hypothetical protein